jgi:hypothetical protein
MSLSGSVVALSDQAEEAEPPVMPTAPGFISDNRRASAHVRDALLGCFLGWRFWLCRKLKHRCLLTLEYVCQENTGAIRKFERVVMHPRLVLVDLPEDRRLGFYYFHPPSSNFTGSVIWCAAMM